jgi:putative FmdB family regulatory protein
MPAYEYRCSTCKHLSEGIFPMSDIPASITCTNCGLDAARVFHAPAIHFKGKGFYATDHKRDPKSSVSTDTKSDSPGPTTSIP